MVSMFFLNKPKLYSIKPFRITFVYLYIYKALILSLNLEIKQLQSGPFGLKIFFYSFLEQYNYPSPPLLNNQHVKLSL